MVYIMTNIRYVKCDVCGKIQEKETTLGWIWIERIVQNNGIMVSNIDICSWKCLQNYIEQFRDYMISKSNLLPNDEELTTS